MRTPRILGAILLAALILRILLYHGFAASDDITYHEEADRLLDGTYRLTDPELDLKGLRFGILVPLALLKSFLPAPLASAVLTIGASLGSIVAVFFLGRRFRSERAGLAAAALLAAAPLSIQMSTCLFPEVLVTFTMLGSLLLFMRARPVPAAVAGVLAGLALTQKENAFYWIPFFAWWAWKERTPGRVWAWGAAGLAVVGIGLLTFYAAFAGDPLHQLRVIDRQYGGELAAIWYPDGASILRRLFLELPSLFFDPRQVSTAAFGFTFVLAAPAAWLLRKDPAARPALVMGAVLLLLFNFFPARLFPYLPNTTLYRYLYPLFIPAALLLGAAADARPRWAIRAAVPFLAVQLACSWAIHADARARNSNVRELAGLLRSRSERIWSDSRTVPALRYQLGRGRDARVLSKEEPPAGDLVLVNYQYLRLNLVWHGLEIPEVFTRARPHWRPIAEVVPRARVGIRRGSFGFRPAAEDRAVLYQVGPPAGP
ncbi:MAG TPA: glycosyltransferase family 39 protein [Planctomycetota bacterium]|nr:glycosyltransferase family 39 protein [Planctomycetota bacterium]